MTNDPVLTFSNALLIMISKTVHPREKACSPEEKQTFLFGGRWRLRTSDPSSVNASGIIAKANEHADLGATMYASL